jgi:hypothetical protein
MPIIGFVMQQCNISDSSSVIFLLHEMAAKTQ